MAYARALGGVGSQRHLQMPHFEFIFFSKILGFFFSGINDIKPGQLVIGRAGVVDS